MSSEKQIRQAIIASLCQHPDAEKYWQKALPGGDPAARVALTAQHSLKKADFLTPDDSGKCIIDSSAAWKNFDKILAAVHANGEVFTLEDFMHPMNRQIGGQRHLLESAKFYRALDKVFSPEVWQGRFEEMERVWYKVPSPDRRNLFKNDGLVSRELKRQIFAAAGKTTPEDRLEKAGLTPADIRKAFEGKGSVHDINDKLKEAGDYLRKEYILMTDSSGDTVFDSRKEAWDRYEPLVRILKANGENFEVADYLRRVSLLKNILGRAAEHKTLSKVFTPAHWESRLPQMMELWSHVMDGWKTASMTSRDFDSAYSEAESLTYAERFKSLKVTGKDDLLKPFDVLSATEKPVIPLGLKLVWDNMDAIRATLKTLPGDNVLTVSDLRTMKGDKDDTLMIGAAKLGHFGRVIDISRESAQPITVEDFLTKDRHGNTLLGILAERNQLSMAFSPDIWVSRVADMKTLWSHVSISQRQQMDFEEAETNAKQATLRLKKSGVKLQYNRPKPKTP